MTGSQSERVGAVLNIVNGIADGQDRRGHGDGLARSRIGLPYSILEPALALSDALLIVICAVVGGLGYQLSIGLHYGDLSVYTGLGLVCSAGYAAVARYVDLYSLQKVLQERRDYLDVLGGWGFVILFLAVVFFLLKLGTDVSRGSVSAFCVLAAVALVGWRKLVKLGLRAALENGAIHGRKTVLIGTPDELVKVRREYLLYRYGAAETDRVVLRPGQFDLRTPGAIDGLLDRIRTVRADQIMLALNWADTSQLELIREYFRIFPLPVRLIPDQSMRQVLEYGGTVSSLLIELQREPLSRFERAMKRASDIVLAATSLLILSPLMLFAAAVIKLETGGPVIFRQRRLGFNNQPFVIYKFRTMRVAEDGPAITQARRNDPRVTPFGRMLRRTSIDELPQLFNVFKGDMSIVGPRPHAIAHDDEYGRMIADYAFRRHVKPGITGWAQVNGFRGGTKQLEQMSKRVEFDLWYIDNWSLAFDLQIVARTVIELARARNAY